MKASFWIKIFTLLFIALILLGVGSFLKSFNKTFETASEGVIPNPEYKKTSVSIAGKVIKALVSDTPEMRDKGLSGHDPLKEDEGMLFVFQSSGEYSFWMKDMLFPLDIIWISSEFKVVHIEKDLQPSSFPKSFGSEKNAKYVLEVNSGFSKENNLKEGDSVKISL